MIASVKNSSIERTVNANNTKEHQQKNKVEGTPPEEALIVEIGNKPEKKYTYDKPNTVKPDMDKIEQLKKQADDALRPLRQMVEELLKQQGMTFNEANLKATEGEMVEIDSKTSAEAQKLISEEGEYGIENTANRLFEFAVAISGGDKTKIDEIKSSIEKGYKEAEKIFGKELPEISKKTFERTMEKLDNWVNNE